MEESFEDKLKALEGELYSKEKSAEEGLRARSRRSEFPHGSRIVPPSSVWEPHARFGETLFSPRRLFKFFFWAFALFVLVTGVVLGFLYLGRRGEEVSLRVESRDRIEAGELVTVSVTVKNVTRVPLKEGELTVVLPERVILKEEGGEKYAPSRLIEKFDTIGPHEEKRVALELRFFGREGEDRLIEATFGYRPENLRARFSVHTAEILTINHVPLALSWEMPETITQNQDLDITLHYVSNARAPVDNLFIRLEYPQGFVFRSGDPAPSNGSAEWRIGTLLAGGNGIIKIRGTISGEEGEVKSFRGELGVYDEKVKSWFPYGEAGQEVRVAVAPLSVRGLLGGERERVIAPGEKLSFALTYKNNTAFAFRNVTIRAFLEELFALQSGTFSARIAPPRVFIPASFVIENGGVFDAASGAIVWGPGGLAALRELAPGAQGTVVFNVDTRGRPLMKSGGDKNIVIRLRGMISAADVPQEFSGVAVGSEDLAQFKVKTKILFGGKAVYRVSPIQNSGPLPPKVGQKTTYTIVWDIRNFTSDIEDVEVRAPVPPNIKWEEVISPKNSRISFDAASSEIVWRVGEVKAGTGIVVPALVGAAQLSLTPTEPDIGKSPILIAGSRLTGRDGFTGVAVNEALPVFSTALNDDPTTSNPQWYVIR